MKIKKELRTEKFLRSDGTQELSSQEFNSKKDKKTIVIHISLMHLV